ncbi:HutD family protein [Massilia arenosa]|uniref:HutD family protein n=1 Tax=Zemynaea arenosa TaxID=2561931 RepID=A0A4Y9SQV5_9BURK|nr:HutD family protein [Massilia arenosa]TFW28855.1 HutD family protein [Massilia arenosa]
MNTRLIPYASLEASLWKNGGGSTVNIAMAPRGAAFEDFDWRISLATIGQDGPFSLFDGVDRTLALVEGKGVLLEIEGDGKGVVDEFNQVYEFPGEARIQATLVDGPTRDFNVMSRRAVCSHQFGRRVLDGESEFAPRGDATVLFMAQGDYLELRNGSERMPLVRFDTVVMEPGARWTLDAREATVFVVDFYYR